MKPISVLATTLPLVPTQSAWTGGDARPPQNPSPHNPVSTQSRLHTIPSPHNPVSTQSRLHTIPSPHNPVSTQSRLHKIPVPLRIFADQPPSPAVSLVEVAVQPRSAAFREGHGFSHAESYACSPDPTAHVGADALVRPAR